jgi:uncharacterized protein YjbI with pentapeptide repeats
MSDSSNNSPSNSRPSTPDSSSCDLSNTDLSNTDLSNCGCDISGYDISGYDLSDCGCDISGYDLSGVLDGSAVVVLDQSGNTLVIDYLTLDVSSVIGLATVTYQQGMTASGDEVTYATMVTNELDPSADVIITENLVSIVDDDMEIDASRNAILNEIRLYAAEIQCEDFHGKGTIDDYKELFIAASKITTDIKQIQLDVDVQGFQDFADAADELSKLFTSFILKLENINIVDDSYFLSVVLDSMKRIANLSKTFEQFKKTILLTTKIHIPKSTQETRVVLEQALCQINCAMNYVNNFASPISGGLPGSELDDEDKQTIQTAVNTINSWSALSDQGVSIAMRENPDIRCITQMSNQVKAKSLQLRDVTNLLKTKMASYNFRV